jgi:CRP/FNR family cyclic AMP-dependent transcriptional regulator
MLTLIEKVLLLQEIDVFQNSTTEDLSHIAAITEIVMFSKGDIIYEEGDISDSLYVVVDGCVRLHRGGTDIMIAEPKNVFGTWALFDDEPRVSAATALEDCTLLRLTKEDFYDLLADHSQITQGVLKTLSMRLRRLLQNVKISDPT